MATDAFDDDHARALGEAIASHSHEDLPAARIDELEDLTIAVGEALAADSPSTGASVLLGFWSGLIARELGVEPVPESPADAAELFAEGFQADAIGVDIYQALSKVATTTQSNGSTPDLTGWTDRLFELTNRHVAHLESHQHDT